MKESVLEKTGTSELATAMVPVLNENNRVRIRGDYSTTVSPQILVIEHPLLAVDELFNEMSGWTIFSKIDILQAYLKLDVDEKAKILFLNTHRLYKFCRSIYGVGGKIRPNI